ncbi:hypothetical protein J6590_108314 [Homalodisca vitripennis]|nr:hypothetical protein J6590_108314 [Homalodisca vitripennis]
MQRTQSDVRPSRYINYRLVPTINDTTEFMTSHEIERQISKIKMGLAVNDEGASEPGSRDTRCNMCLTMKAIRMATPCGHIVVCRLCAVSLTEDEIFHQVTNSDGTIFTTHIRLPLTCPICRAIVGAFIKPF